MAIALNLVRPPYTFIHQYRRKDETMGGHKMLKLLPYVFGGGDKTNSVSTLEIRNSLNVNTYADINTR